MTVTESLVQVTVVAGPPVEIQVRVNMKFGSRVKVTSADAERLPVTILKCYKGNFLMIGYCNTSSTVVQSHMDSL